MGVVFKEALRVLWAAYGGVAETNSSYAIDNILRFYFGLVYLVGKNYISISSVNIF